jgi:hypothetical protein
MKTASAKAKGRRLCKLVKEKLLEVFDLQDDDVKVTSSGATGEDIHLSPFARVRFPHSIECKNHAKMSIYTHYEQAVENAGGHIPLLIVKADGKQPLAVLDLDHYLSIAREATK